MGKWQFTVENGKVTIHSGKWESDNTHVKWESDITQWKMGKEILHSGKVTLHSGKVTLHSCKVTLHSRVVNMSTWIYHSLVIKVNVNNQRKCSFWQFSPTTVTRGIKVPCQHHSFTGQKNSSKIVFDDIFTTSIRSGLLIIRILLNCPSISYKLSGLRQNCVWLYR